MHKLVEVASYHVGQDFLVVDVALHCKICMHCVQRQACDLVDVSASLLSLRDLAITVNAD